MYSVKYAIPGDVQVEVSGKTVKVKGKAGENKRAFVSKNVLIKKEGSEIEVYTESPKKADRADVGTIMGHIRNMVHGSEKGFTYKLKAVYAHFPMTIKVEGESITVNNFLGEKSPRKIKLVSGAQVKVSGQEITVTGSNKEAVGLCAAQIEQICKVRDRDRRVFQDGIYIIEKDGKKI